MEVFAAGDDLRLIGRNALHIIGPFPSDFDGGLHRFRSRVHRKDLVVSKIRCHKLLVLAKIAIEKGSRRQGQFLRLLCHGRHNPRMTMALIDGRICTEKVKILLAFNVPHVNTLSTVQNHWKGVVIVRAMRIL